MFLCSVVPPPAAELPTALKREKKDWIKNRKDRYGMLSAHTPRWAALVKRKWAKRVSTPNLATDEVHERENIAIIVCWTHYWRIQFSGIKSFLCLPDFFFLCRKGYWSKNNFFFFYMNPLNSELVCWKKEMQPETFRTSQEAESFMLKNRTFSLVV